MTSTGHAGDGGSGDGGSGPIRVAVVDDQPLLVSAFAAFLERQADMTVVGTAGDGAQAVALCRARDVDVVLTDLRMPVLDGVDATRALTETNPEIAARLQIAESTVKTHVGNLLTKLDCRDRVALVVLAHAAGTG
ncbi:MAG: response regulator transcription factor [Pseudonocardia sediminis]